jgi:hypothetical protein
MRSGGKRRVDLPTSLADYSGVQQLWASAVALLAFLHAASVATAESECPFLGKDPGAEPRRVDLNAGPAQLFGQHEGHLFAFGATPGCAGCEVTAAGSFYDACHNEWQIQRLSLGRGFRMDDATIRRFGDRVVGLTLAVRRNPALDPESDYTLLQSDTRGVVFDLRRRKLFPIPRHEREWSSGQDIIDGFADANERYVVYVQKPRGSGARVFVYDVARGRWGGHFKAPPGLGRLLSTSGSELWFELISSDATGARHLVFSPTTGSVRSVRSAPPDSGATTAGQAKPEVRHSRGSWSGSLTMPIERAEQRYELSIRVRSVPGPNGCENVRGRPCDPVVAHPTTRLEATIQ